MNKVIRKGSFGFVYETPLKGTGLAIGGWFRLSGLFINEIWQGM